MATRFCGHKERVCGPRAVTVTGLWRQDFVVTKSEFVVRELSQSRVCGDKILWSQRASLWSESCHSHGFVATRFCGHKERVCGPRAVTVTGLWRQDFVVTKSEFVVRELSQSRVCGDKILGSQRASLWSESCHSHGFVATRFCGHKERVCGPRAVIVTGLWRQDFVVTKSEFVVRELSQLRVCGDKILWSQRASLWSESCHSHGFVATRFCGHKERVCGPRAVTVAGLWRQDFVVTKSEFVVPEVDQGLQTALLPGASAILLGSQTRSFTAVAFEKLSLKSIFF